MSTVARVLWPFLISLISIYKESKTVKMIKEIKGTINYCQNKNTYITVFSVDGNSVISISSKVWYGWRWATYDFDKGIYGNLLYMYEAPCHVLCDRFMGNGVIAFMMTGVFEL